MKKENDPVLGWIVFLSILMGACNAICSCRPKPIEPIEPCGVTLEVLDSLHMDDSITTIF